MEFNTAAGSIDIEIGDCVKLQPGTLPSAPQFKDFATVLSISTGTQNELIVQYNTGTALLNANLDAGWVIANYRPITS
jgi:hypothetical protein